MTHGVVCSERGICVYASETRGWLQAAGGGRGQAGVGAAAVSDWDAVRSRTEEVYRDHCVAAAELCHHPRPRHLPEVRLCCHPD